MGSTAVRCAISVGTGTHEYVFAHLGNVEHPLLTANNVEDLKRFVRYATGALADDDPGAEQERSAYDEEEGGTTAVLPPPPPPNPSTSGELETTALRGSQLHSRERGLPLQTNQRDRKTPTSILSLTISGGAAVADGYGDAARRGRATEPRTCRPRKRSPDTQKQSRGNQ